MGNCCEPRRRQDQPQCCVPYNGPLPPGMGQTQQAAAIPTAIPQATAPTFPQAQQQLPQINVQFINLKFHSTKPQPFFKMAQKLFLSPIIVAYYCSILL